MSCINCCAAVPHLGHGSPKCTSYCVDALIEVVHFAEQPIARHTRQVFEVFAGFAANDLGLLWQHDANLAQATGCG